MEMKNERDRRQISSLPLPHTMPLPLESGTLPFLYPVFHKTPPPILQSGDHWEVLGQKESVSENFSPKLQSPGILTTSELHILQMISPFLTKLFYSGAQSHWCPHPPSAVDRASVQVSLGHIAAPTDLLGSAS